MFDSCTLSIKFHALAAKFMIHPAPPPPFCSPLLQSSDHCTLNKEKKLSLVALDHTASRLIILCMKHSCLYALSLWHIVRPCLLQESSCQVLHVLEVSPLRYSSSDILWQSSCASKKIKNLKFPFEFRENNHKSSQGWACVNNEQLSCFALCCWGVVEVLK